MRKGAKILGLFEIIFQGHKIQITVQSRSTIKYVSVAHKFDWPLMGPSKVGKVFFWHSKGPFQNTFHSSEEEWSFTIFTDMQ